MTWTEGDRVRHPEGSGRVVAIGPGDDIDDVPLPAGSIAVKWDDDGYVEVRDADDPDLTKE